MIHINMHVTALIYVLNVLFHVVLQINENLGGGTWRVCIYALTCILRMHFLKK